MRELIERTTQLSQKGYVSGSSGNISMRFSENRMMISVTGAKLDRITEENMVLTSLDGKVKDGDEGKIPSKERIMHGFIYKRRPDIQVLLHFHPVDCMAAGILLGPDRYLPIYVPAHRIRVGNIYQVGLYKAGSEELAWKAAEAFEKANAVLLYRHGIVVGGENAAQACDRVEYVVEACRFHLHLKGYGAMEEKELEAYINAKI